MKTLEKIVSILASACLAYSFAWFVVVLVMLTGCDPGCPQYERLPRQDEAEVLSWHDVLGRTEPPPGTRWGFDRCPSQPDNPKTAVLEPNGTCRSGITWSFCYTQVAWRGSFSKSAYIHEQQHAADYRDGISDPNHLRWWKWMVADTLGPHLLEERGL